MERGEGFDGLKVLVSTIFPSDFKGTMSHFDNLFFFVTWLNRVSERSIVSLPVNAPNNGPWLLLGKWSHLALMLLKSAQVLLSLPHALRIVVPRVRTIANTFTVAPTWHLIRLAYVLPVIDLFA